MGFATALPKDEWGRNMEKTSYYAENVFRID